MTVDMHRPQGTRRASAPRSPILTYHGITPWEADPGPRNPKYDVHPERFRDQLTHIRARGYEAMSLSAWWSGSGRRPVVLTFDDGWASMYERAWPLLADAGLHADCFVNTATIGSRGFLTWAQITEMQRHGMTFHSHSHEHVALSGLALRELERQVGDSKRLLEDRLGSAVQFLAAPYGLVNRRVVKAALAQGYHAICTSWNWLARPGARTINRAAVYRDTSLEEFDRLLRGSLVAYGPRVAREMVVHLPRLILLRAHVLNLNVFQEEHAP